MLKSIKSNYLPARPYNRHTSVVDLSTDFSAGNISKRNNKMSIEDIISELDALKSVGVKVSNNAYKLAKTENLDEYDNMSVTEATDLIITLANI